MGTAITGWGIALPSDRLSNAELARRFNVDEDWIFQRTGIESRTVAGEGETTSTLAIEAGARALESARVDPEDLDLVILSTCTPDFRIPAAAPLVQAGLGARNAGAYDVNAVCAGFLYGLAQAASLVETGTMRRVLVCGADVFTRVTDYSDLGSAILFGDGAGAVVVQDVDAPVSIGPFHLASDGSTANLLYIPNGKDVVEMKGREIYRHAVDEMTRSVQRVLFQARLSISQVRLLVAHQANGRILDSVAERLGLGPDRVVNNIAHLGNTSAASIPIALAEAAENASLEQGDVVVLTAIGGGLVWGAGVLRWHRADSIAGAAVPMSFVGDTRA